MTTIEFNDAVKQIVQREEHMRQIKTSDYGDSSDIFQSIQTISKEIGVQPAKVLLTFLHKHINSIYKAVKENELRPVCLAEPLVERIMDARAYLLLLLLFLQENDTIYHNTLNKPGALEAKLKKKRCTYGEKETNIAS